jgi:hypothetical protein
MAAVTAIHGLSGRLTALRHISQSDRLLALDEIWSSHLSTADDRDAAALERDLPILRELAPEIGALTQQVAKSAGELRNLLSDLDPAVMEEAFDQIAAQHPLGEELRAPLAEVLEDYDLRGAAITACDDIVSQAVEEGKHLEEDIVKLEQGQLPPGSLSSRFRCALYLAGLGAGIALAVLSPPVLAMLAATQTVSGGILGWETGQCGQAWAAITAGRRA